MDFLSERGVDSLVKVSIFLLYAYKIIDKRSNGLYPR